MISTKMISQNKKRKESRTWNDAVCRVRLILIDAGGVCCLLHEIFRKDEKGKKTC